MRWTKVDLPAPAMPMTMIAIGLSDMVEVRRKNLD